MKITKAKLKQIIKEELGNIGYGPAQPGCGSKEEDNLRETDGAFSFHTSKEDPLGTSQELTDALATILSATKKLQSERNIGDLGALYQSANILSKWLDNTYPESGPTAKAKARGESDIAAL